MDNSLNHRNLLSTDDLRRLRVIEEDLRESNMYDGEGFRDAEAIRRAIELLAKHGLVQPADGEAETT